MNKLTSVNMR